METMRTLNKLLKEKGGNGTPVPMIISKDIADIKEHIELHYD